VNDRICPKCGHELECDMVDIGVGEMQCGPWGCPACHWVEDDPSKSAGFNFEAADGEEGD
jgi:hypothetical protein